MSKQKSYVITDVADQMAAEIAEANGLSKSAVIEVLIRQAHAGGWSVSNTVIKPADSNTATEPTCGVYPAARLLGVTQSTISGWSRLENGLPFVQRGHKRIYKEQDLLTFAKENGKSPRYGSLTEVYADYPSLKGK